MTRNKTEVYTAKKRIADQKAEQREKNIANTKTCPVCSGRGMRCWGTKKCAACNGRGRVDIRMSYQKAWEIVEQDNIGRTVSRSGGLYHGHASSHNYCSNSGLSKGDQRHRKYRK